MKFYTLAALAAMAAISPALASPKVVQMDVHKPNRRSVTPAQIQRRAKSVGADFDAAYGDGTTVSGDYINDTVAFNGATVNGVQMGLADDGKTDFPLAGILGIGYSSGEALVIEDEKPRKQYPNVVEQMKAQGVINTQAYSLWLNDLGEWF